MTNTTHAKARGAFPACRIPAVLCVVLVAALCLGVAGLRAHAAAFADTPASADAPCAYADAAYEAPVSGPGGASASVADSARPAVAVTVFQRIEAPAWSSGVQNTWSYALEALDDACPMPAGSENGRYVWRMTGDEKASIVIPAASAPGIYRYRMAQERPADVPAGYELDARVYEVHAYAADDGTVYAVVCREEGGAAKEADPGWTVGFTPPAPASPDPAPQGPVSQLLSHLPKTGDIAMLAMLAAGVCALVGIVAIVIARRLRDKDGADGKVPDGDAMRKDVR